MKTKNSKPAAPFAYEGLNRVIHERARLSVLTSLITHPNGLSFVELKQFCALTDGNLARHLQVLEEDGMGLAGVGAPQDDDLSLLHLAVGAGTSTCTEDRRQTDDAGGVSGSVAAVDVVAADGGAEELLGDVVHFVGRLAAAEDADRRRATRGDLLLEAGGRAFQRFVPRRDPKLPAVPHHRLRQALELFHGGEATTAVACSAARCETLRMRMRRVQCLEWERFDQPGK